MTNKIVAIQGNNPSKLNPVTDTSVFLAHEIQNKNYKIFYYDPKDLSIINSKVIAAGCFIEFNYKNKKFFKILKKQELELTKCKFILIRQDPPFNLEYISATYILDTIKDKVKILNNPTSIRNISEKLYSAKYLKFMPSTIFTKDIIEIKKVDDKFYYKEDKYMYSLLKKSIQKEDTIYQFRRHYVRENKSNVCPTLTANMGTGGHNVPLIKTKFGFRKLTPRECFRFQGFTDSYKLPNIANRHLYKQSGNSVSVSVISKIAKEILKVLDQSIS